MINIEQVSVEAAYDPNPDGSVAHMVTVVISNEGNADTGSFSVGIGSEQVTVSSLPPGSDYAATVQIDLQPGNRQLLVSAKDATETVAVEIEQPHSLALYRVRNGTRDLSLEFWQEMERHFPADTIANATFEAFVDPLADLPPPSQTAVLVSPFMATGLAAVTELIEEITPLHPQVQVGVLQIPEWVNSPEHATNMAWAGIVSEFYSNTDWRTVKDLDNRPESHTRAVLFAGATYNPSDYTDCGLEALFEQQGVTTDTILCDGYYFGNDPLGTERGNEYFLRVQDPVRMAKDQLKAEIHHYWLESSGTLAWSLLEFSADQMTGLDYRDTVSKATSNHILYRANNSTFMHTPPTGTEHLTTYQFFLQIANAKSWRSTPDAGPMQVAAERILDWAVQEVVHALHSSYTAANANRFGQLSPQRPFIPPAWAVPIASTGEAGAIDTVGSPMMADLFISAFRSIGIPAFYDETPRGHGGMRFAIDDGTWRYVAGNDPIGQHRVLAPHNGHIGEFHYSEEEYRALNQ